VRVCGVALCLALAAPGCGKSAVQQFADQLKPLEQQVAVGKAQLSSTLSTVRLRNRDDARVLRHEIRGLGVVQAQIARLGAPGEVKVPFAGYTSASAGQIAVLNRFVAALVAGDRAGLTALGQQVQLSEGAVRRAEDALHAKFNAQ
jgi:hypothetical protein